MTINIRFMVRITPYSCGKVVSSLTSGGRYNCKPWGLPTYKFVLDLGDAIQGGKGTIDKEPFQTSYIRLAELYLIYAEALAETGNNVKGIGANQQGKSPCRFR